MNGYGRGEDHQPKGGAKVVTRETFGMTLLLFSVVLLVISIIGSYILGEIGVAITAFLLGVCGFFIYPFLAFCIYFSVVLVAGKNFLPVKTVLKGLFTLAACFLIAHLATSARFVGSGFGGYLGGCWGAAETSAAGATAGGVLFGLVAYPCRAVLSQAGAYVLFSALLALSLFLWATPFLRNRRTGRPKPEKEEEPERGIPFDELPRASSGREKPQKSRKPLSKPAASGASGADSYRSGYDNYQNGYGYQNEYNGYRDEYGYQNSYQNGYQNEYSGYPEGYGLSGGYDSAQSGYNEPYPSGYGRFYDDNGTGRNGYAPEARGGRPGDGYGTSDDPQPAANDGYGRRYPEETEPHIPSGREILFGDPARDFRANLAFNRDSAFYNHVRRSSIEPDRTPVRPSQTGYGEPRTFGGPSAPSAGYAESYRAGAETPKQEMPRKIVEQRPERREDGYRLRADELNYPQTPSYKSPKVPPESDAVRDRYANDVPVEEEFSSAPNINDFQDEPPRNDLRRAPVEPTPEPVRSEPRRPDFRTEKPAELADDRNPAGSVRGREGASRDSNPEVFSRDRGGEIGFEDLDFGRDRGETPAREEGRFDSREESRFDSREENRFDSREESRFDSREEGRFDAREESRFDSREEGRFDSREENRFDSREESRFDSREESRFDAREEGRFDGGEEEPPASRALDGLRSNSDLFDGEDDLEEANVGIAAKSGELSGRPAPRPVQHVYKPYQRPALSLFREYEERIAVPQEEIERNSQIIIDTLSGFRVDAEIMKVTTGPSVTRYDINVPINISVGSVTKRSGEIAMRLHARDGVNMYANNAAGMISIEVPNSVRSTVGIRSVMQSEEYLSDQPSALMFVIGKDVEGRSVCGNITTMKHLLVAGATGSGKSVCLNSMLISLICKYSPEELRLILIDPKKVEFAIYDGLPHLMINEIVADAQKAVMALNWAIKEMERRFDLFEQKTRSGTVVRNLDEYNGSLSEDEQKLPKIVIVVDELADLMSVAKKDIEERIQRIAQKARAAGIHLVIATQRPSVDVITGVIKGNLPTRMAFRVIQEVDSRTILDESGAEKLLGNGDLLYKTEGMFHCLRVQGAFLSSSEVQTIVEDIKANNEAYFDPDVTDYINRTENAGSDDDEDEDSASGGDLGPEYLKALKIVVKLGQASISLIQRKCSVGYNHAGKILEWMEMMGYISPFDGKAKARSVLLTKEEFEAKYGPLE